MSKNSCNDSSSVYGCVCFVLIMVSVLMKETVLASCVAVAVDAELQEL